MSQNTLPTQQELDTAMELITRAARAGMEPTPKPTPNLDRKMKAYRQQREKNKALAIECKKTGEAVHARIMADLPEHLKDFFTLYTMMWIANYAITEKTYSLFNQAKNKLNKLLAADKLTAKANKPKRKGK